MKHLIITIFLLFTATNAVLAQDVDPCNVLSNVLQEADKACVEGKYMDALTWLEKLKNNPNMRDCSEMKKGIVDDKIQKIQKNLAENSDAETLFDIGNNYYMGKGVPQDYQQAMEWYRKAAVQGHAGAQHNLGYCYQYGQGVPKDISRAKEYYRKAVEQGSETAKENLERLK